jgi:enoyl-CoA hydratase
MPEVSIGFFPDVGGTFVLSRLPGEVGTWVALTGDRLKTADAVAAGIATHRVGSARFPELLDALCGNVPVDALLAAFAEKPEEGPVMARRAAIDRLFAGDRIEDILGALDAEAAGGEHAEWAASTAATIRTKSPTSLRLALAQVRRGKNWSFDECMQAEFRIVSRIVYGHDFYEGVRAVIVDKDNAPKWRPASLADVDEATVERHFAPLGEDELRLP